MKVSESLNNPSNITGIPGKEERKAPDTKGASFQSRLRNVEEQNFDERIQALADKIVQQGTKLGKKTDIRELKIYKNLISEFLEEAVGNSHKFSKKNLLDRRGRHKVYATVKKVNEELENLTKDVLAGEKNNLLILSRLDDIRGLILDLIM